MAKTTKKSSSKRSAKKTSSSSRSGEGAETTKAGKSKDVKPKAAKSKDAPSKDVKPKAAKSKDAPSKDAKTKDAKPKAAKSKDVKPKAAKSKDVQPKEAKSKEGKSKEGKSKDKDDDGKGGKRKLGLRGAAPWAARHAAKHAAEARARAAEPAPPGSARATIRVPEGAEQIKAKISELHNQTTKIRTLRKRMERGFFEIGEILAEIQEQELFQAKGYGSFEAFLEREIDLGKQTSLKLVKLSKVFQREAALDYGMDKCIVGLSALDGEAAPKAAPSTPGSNAPLPLPLKPPMRAAGV